METEFVRVVIGPTLEWSSFVFSYPAGLSADESDALGEIPGVDEIVLYTGTAGYEEVCVNVASNPDEPGQAVKLVIMAINRLLDTTLVLGSVTVLDPRKPPEQDGISFSNWLRQQWWWLW